MTTSRKHSSQKESSIKTANQCILICLATLSYFIMAVDGLECFQCVSTSAQGGDCLWDHDGLINATKNEPAKKPSPYRKDCTGSNTKFTRCFIEYYLGPEDDYLFYHRGCHDGVTFNAKVSSSRFTNLSANNETTCAKPTGLVNTVVCYIFCDTDMCNGPQYVPDPCANTSDPNATRADGTFCGVNSCHGNAWLGVMLSVVVTSVSIWFTIHVKS